MRLGVKDLTFDLENWDWRRTDLGLGESDSVFSGRGSRSTERERRGRGERGRREKGGRTWLGELS